MHGFADNRACLFAFVHVWNNKMKREKKKRRAERGAFPFGGANNGRLRRKLRLKKGGTTHLRELKGVGWCGGQGKLSSLFFFLFASSVSNKMDTRWIHGSLNANFEKLEMCECDGCAPLTSFSCVRVSCQETARVTETCDGCFGRGRGCGVKQYISMIF